VANFIISGVKEFNSSLTALDKRAVAAARKSVIEMSQELVAAARREFTTVVSGGAAGTRVLGAGESKGKGEKIMRKGNHVGGESPHIRTGYLARSIKADNPRQIGFGRVATEVAPRAAYGRRIELGFTGTDSAAPGRKGRNYDQPPYPYMRPALEKSMPKLEEINKRAWLGVFGG